MNLAQTGYRFIVHYNSNVKANIFTVCPFSVVTSTKMTGTKLAVHYTYAVLTTTHVTEVMHVT